ncbi:MAG: glycosyltransferase family 2 protein [Chroococcidiopsidaceae cyanobacterium CP_BM_ER_R8_30]|nr:glycosyltransferase family 2 protein [Chroococcidiopsidaceae cyanobacterium CP_BM_ER_R8_30]
MTKLIIQIPCFNEEKTLGITLSELPREIPGIDSVEWLVIDDGSTDKTLEVAKAYNVDHIVKFPQNCGLARAFMAGIEACTTEGADIIVNTDADNQYCADDIFKLIEPILAGEADIVIGARPIAKIQHFSSTKKLLQKLGSWVVCVVSNAKVPDATSGFRAMSRNAAVQLNVFNDYTYTLETIIQAGQKGIAITSVPIRVNGKTRKSRLVKSLHNYIIISTFTIIRIFVTYRPFRFFVRIGAVLFSLGMVINLRFLYLYLLGEGQGKIQSLILASVLTGLGFHFFVLGLLADLIDVNRKLLEKLNLRIQRLEEKFGEFKRND